ncbi:DUF6973 domain-containing protein [Tenacibaculum ovolyticum]|uniref:DUF6973 domain-containing protein n=1 Tax=Tenacibaculum ovolyticum TaxID=104270 RepID=UPI000405F0AC|nr:hypothetical protein [Tenacibaculum ovolyticum]
MRKINYLLLPIILLLFNCSDKETLVSNENEEKQSISENLSTYKGLPVLNRLNTPIVDYKKTTELKRKEQPISFDEFSLDEIALAVKEELVKFPFITDKSIADDKRKFLMNDFPTLSTEEIDENITIIENYYYKSLDYLVYIRLLDKKQRGSSQSYKGADYGNEQVNCINKKHGVFKNYGGDLGSKAMALYAFKKAAIAKNIAKQVFSSLDESDTKLDAYRHILWSALLCNNYLTVSSKSPKLAYAKAVTDAWELCSTDNKEDAHEMDYHNNAIGRKVYNDNTQYKTLLGANIGLKSPSLALLKIKTKYVVDRAFLVKGSTVTEVANKIRTKKFNVVIGHEEERRYICDENGNQKLPRFTPYIYTIDQNNKCWATFYGVPYEYYDANKAVYISEKLK